MRFKFKSFIIFLHRKSLEKNLYIDHRLNILNFSSNQHFKDIC